MQQAWITAAKDLTDLKSFFQENAKFKNKRLEPYEQNQ